MKIRILADDAVVLSEYEASQVVQALRELSAIKGRESLKRLAENIGRRL